MKLLPKIFLTLSVAQLCACSTYAPKPDESVHYSKAQIEQDFESFLTFVKSTHPDLSNSADMEDLARLALVAQESFRDDMPLREAWQAMAVVNPAFADAHTGLRRPVAALEAYKADGGVLFPVPVVIDQSGAVRVGPGAPANARIHSGDEIISINGRTMASMVKTLSPRIRGESPALRRLILERYFGEYFWVAHGGFEKYDVRLRGGGGVRTVSVSPEDWGHETTSAEKFSFKMLNDDVGYLNVRTFDVGAKDEFSGFLQRAFADVKEFGADRLIIDLRENGGGARDLSDQLAGYLTAKEFSSTSSIRARVTSENIARIPGAKLGDVVTLPFRQTATPPADIANRFDGDVYILVGKLTYSQAIVFAAAMQDNEIAKIAGEETEGPANQTGQVQTLPLANTGIEALAPLYIFTRASGDASRHGVIPDIPVANDPQRPEASLEQLLKELASR